PENVIIISLGMGISALSNIISKNIPTYPVVEMNDMTNSMTGLRISNTMPNYRIGGHESHKYLFWFGYSLFLN
ncbi:MAG: hypothetical protein WCE25_11720, partial [Nitrososphaeraceae archaeon]